MEYYPVTDRRIEKRRKINSNWIVLRTISIPSLSRCVLMKLSIFPIYFITPLAVWLRAVRQRTACCSSRNLYLKIVFRFNKRIHLLQNCANVARTHTHAWPFIRMAIATLSIFKWPIPFGHFVAAPRVRCTFNRHLAFAYIYLYRQNTINSCVESVYCLDAT